MSSYESAPATKMLASHCAACGRPLLDAKSVETGMGPDCRKLHGYNIEVSEEARKEANKLVYQIALEQEGADVVRACVRLGELGFERLAARILKRVNVIKVEGTANVIELYTPYNEAAVEDARRIPGRRWDNKRKCNTYPSTSKPQIWEHLKRHFAGKMGIGPKGAFEIPCE